MKYRDFEVGEQVIIILSIITTAATTTTTTTAIATTTTTTISKEILKTHDHIRWVFVDIRDYQGNLS